MVKDIKKKGEKRLKANAKIIWGNCKVCEPLEDKRDWNTKFISEWREVYLEHKGIVHWEAWGNELLDFTLAFISKLLKKKEKEMISKIRNDEELNDWLRNPRFVEVRNALENVLQVIEERK